MNTPAAKVTTLELIQLSRQFSVPLYLLSNLESSTRVSSLLWALCALSADAVLQSVDAKCILDGLAELQLRREREIRLQQLEEQFAAGKLPPLL